MLNKIIGFSVKNKLIIGLFVLSLIGWGTYELTKLPIDALPDITDNRLPALAEARYNSGGSNFTEREILYKLIFDLFQNLTILLHLQ